MIAKVSKWKQFRNHFHHLWSIGLFIFATIIILFAITLVTIRESTPLLANHHQEIQKWLSHRLNHPIKIGKLQAGWRGYEPIIKISDVTIETKNHQPLLHVGNFEIGFNLIKTITSKRLRIGIVALANAKVKIIETAKGNIIFYSGKAKTPFATIYANKKGKGDLLEDLFLINKIFISHVNIDWQKADGRLIHFTNVNLQIVNKLKNHNAWGKADLKQPNKGRLSFVTHFTGNIIDKNSLNGETYIKGNNLSLYEWSPLESYRSIAILKGIANGESWLTIHNGEITKVQSKFSAKNILLKNYQSNKVFSLPAVKINGNWQALNEKTWRLVINQLQIPAVFEKTDKLYLEFNQGKNSNEFKGMINHLPAGFFEKFIKFANILGAEKKLDKYFVSGKLHNIFFNYQNSNDYALHFNGNNLSLKDKKSQEGITNLNLSANIFAHMGDVTLSSKHSKLFMQTMAFKTMDLKPFAMTIYWRKDHQHLSIFAPSINLANSQIRIQGKAQAVIPLKDFKQTLLTLDLKTSSFLLPQLQEYLPIKPKNHKNLIKFLKSAFKSGSAQAHLLVSGHLDHIFSENINVIPNILLTARLHNLNLLYKQGWPQIKEANGHLFLLNNQLMIKASQGKLYNMQLRKINATIPDIANETNPEIDVNGVVQTKLQRVQSFINHTPLQNKLGKKIAELRFSGPGQLHLHLAIPLKHNTFKTRASGQIFAKNAKVSIPSLQMEFNQVNGLLNFTNDSLQGSNIKAVFAKQPVAVTIQTIAPGEKQSDLQLSVNGILTANYLKTRFPNAFSKQLFGKTKYSAQMNLYNHLSGKADNLIMKANLKDLTSKLPKPLQKNNFKIYPLQVRLAFLPKKTMLVKANLNHQIYFKGKLTDTKGSKHLYGGLLYFGEHFIDKPIPKGLDVYGTLKFLDWKRWDQYLVKNSFKENPNQGKLDIHGINLKIAETNFYNFLLLRTHFLVKPESDFWHITASGPDISGVIDIPHDKNLPIDANLKRLFLLPYPVHTKESHQALLSPMSFPGFNARIDDFRYETRTFGSIQLRTKRVPKGVAIEKISSETPTYQFSASGRWLMNHKKQMTYLNGTLKAASISEILQKFSVKDTSIDASQLKDRFQLHWQGNPFEPSLKSLNGKFSIKTANGVIKNLGKKANSDLATGQIITFLSLSSLQKRLLFNFDDLGSKGFHFGSMKGDFTIDDGDAWTNNSKINGIVASIDINGRIGLANKDFDLFTEVTPHVTSSLPVIATIAGGPIVGAATYLVNKIVAPSINHMAASYFEITGTWSHPKITKLSVDNKQNKRKSRAGFERF